MEQVDEPQSIATKSVDHQAGPTVDDDVRHLLVRHGPEAVKSAMKRALARKPGRKSIQDWPELQDILLEDAHLWLRGVDPFKKRSNNSIAINLVASEPGHSADSSKRRIMGKLGKRRQILTLVTAVAVSANDYPYTAHIKAIEALIAIDHKKRWPTALARIRELVARYTENFGEPTTDLSVGQMLSQIQELEASPAINRTTLVGGIGSAMLPRA